MTIWDHLAERTKPAGLSVVVEDRKTVVRVVTGALAGSVLAAVIQAAVFFSSAEPLAGWSSVVLGVAYTGAWVCYAVTGSVAGATAIAVLASSVDVVVVHLALGGYANSGATLMWSTILLLSAVLVFPRAFSLGLGAFYAAVAVTFGFLEQSLRAGRAPPDPAVPAVIFAAVLAGNVALILLILSILMRRLGDERQRSESLLLNVLPADVAAELKEHSRYPARRFDSASVLFVDVVGFTPLAASSEPEETVARLNEVFTHFDGLADRYGVEKIRTIGDAYVAVAGVPVPTDDHAEALAGLALDILRYADSSPLSFRIGISSGPVVAGVIGTRKFQYDLWGDTVNTASRMESSGEPDRAQISESTYQLVKHSYATTPRGRIEVKGKGILATWWLDPVDSVRGAGGADPVSA